MKNKLIPFIMLIRATICDTIANCPRKAVSDQYE